MKRRKETGARLPGARLLVYGSDHEADGLEGIEPSSVFRPKDSILKLAAVNPPAVPDSIQVGLATSVIPPAALMEVGTVT